MRIKAMQSSVKLINEKTKNSMSASSSQFNIRSTKKGILNYKVFSVFTVLIILASALFMAIGSGTIASTGTIHMTGSIVYPSPTPTPNPSAKNLAPITSGFYMTFGTSPQYAFLDYTVTRNGNPSIRVQADSTGYREVDGHWYDVKPGDKLYASAWIKTADSTPADDNNALLGARIGMDLYGVLSNGQMVQVDCHPHDGDEHYASVVRWNTPDWTHKTWNITVPSDYFTKTIWGDSIPPTQVSQVVIWLDGRPTDSGANAWFADTELYINP
jgi:hypothetical protein